MRFFLSIFAFLLVCFFSPVYPHAILVEPKARNGQAIDPGIKIPQPQGPTAAQLLGCGGTQGADPGPGTIAATYTAGQSIRVSWDVTIPHSSPPGVRIALKYSDTDSFDKNLIVSGVDVDSNKNAANGVAWTTITLPAGKTSQNAVLQWIWHSTSDGGYYIACSDIRINAATGGGGGATTTTAAPTTRTTATTTTADPDAETTETPTTEGPETTEPAITEEPEETTTTRRIQTSTSRQSTGTTSSGTRTTTSTTRRPYSTNPLIGQQQVGPANAATNGRNTVIAFIMASVMVAFMRFFH